MFSKIGGNVFNVIEKVRNHANNKTQHFLNEKHSNAVSNRNNVQQGTSTWAVALLSTC